MKQIATKSKAGGSANEILAEFYGNSNFPLSAWPYTKKDFVRYFALLSSSLGSCTTCKERKIANDFVMAGVNVGVPDFWMGWSVCL